jgi:hypothetical protein
MASIFIQKIGDDKYTVTDAADVGREAKSAELNILDWEELQAHILEKTPIPTTYFQNFERSTRERTPRPT